MDSPLLALLFVTGAVVELIFIPHSTISTLRNAQGRLIFVKGIDPCGGRDKVSANESLMSAQ